MKRRALKVIGGSCLILALASVDTANSDPQQGLSGPVQTTLTPLMLRSTSIAYQGDLGGRTGATQKCQAEFAGSHFAHRTELDSATETRGVIWLSSETDASWVDEFGTAFNCGGGWVETVGVQGRVVNAMGTNRVVITCAEAHPILCAN